MQHQLILRDSISINAPASVVWDILVNPQETKKYMFGCSAMSDWKIDSPLLWTANIDGADRVFVKGNIVELEQHRFLAYTTIDPHSRIEDIPENYLTVTYELSVENEHTILIITQGDFAVVEDGERRFGEAVKEGGWNPILVQIKHIAESKKS